MIPTATGVTSTSPLLGLSSKWLSAHAYCCISVSSPYSLQPTPGKHEPGKRTPLTSLDPSQLPNVTLANMVPQSSQDGFRKQDLQPVLVELLQTALSAARGNCILLDTYKISNQLSRASCSACLHFCSLRLQAAVDAGSLSV